MKRSSREGQFKDGRRILVEVVTLPVGNDRENFLFKTPFFGKEGLRGGLSNPLEKDGEEDLDGPRTVGRQFPECMSFALVRDGIPYERCGGTFLARVG